MSTRRISGAAILVTALEALRRNALRSALTALGIIIGVGAVIVMMAIGDGARQSIESRIRSAGTNLVIVTPGSATVGGARLGQGAVTTLDRADAETIAHASGRALPLLFKTTDTPVTFTLKGYAFSHETSAISGDTWVTYDPHTPKTYEIPSYRDLVATESVRLPAAYAIPPQWTDVIDKLAEHGIRTERLAHAASVDAERYELTKPVWADKPFEGRHMLRDFAIASNRGTLALPAGTVIVPIDQPAANVAANLLEPRAPDSLVRWGFLDAIFEQKESPDARVAEALAREMLAKDPALKAEFEARLAADPAFAAKPEARLAFFYERSPWYATQKVGVYPVLRLDAAALGALRLRH